MIQQASHKSVFAPDVIVKDASLVYENKLLFEHLHLFLPKGQWTCLLGPSGIGKTTLLRLLAGLPLNAKAKADIQVSDNLPLKGRVAYMAQSDLLLPWATVLENIFIGKKLRNETIQTEDRIKAQSLLDVVNLAAYANAYPATLSGGMKQRVALARTLFEDKALVLMDEPFAAIDAITKWRLQELFAQLLQQKTVLLVTHDPVEALRLGHRIHILAGQPAIVDEPLILTSDTPRDLNHPCWLEWQQHLITRLKRTCEC